MGDQIPRVNRQIAQGRAMGQCERCLTYTLDGDLHHRRPKGLGGSKLLDRHDVANLVYVCRPCHNWAHANPTAATAAGFLVPRSSGIHFTTVPITNFAGNSRFLDNEGRYLEAVADV